eukprot:CAMPEP_0114309274 /NCGR_PEP_ID=MMETSP0059-20121206/18546_1 /TAXON_ID=36894 /ORGANISM="Pyramimonas parkeae, Strain CCMP726" /LENGTH=171 /DNA_ID=CAMNT_0001433055 /DNA_START=249 /DNA_END=765 /DNA_ORIENTATION=+
MQPPPPVDPYVAIKRTVALQQVDPGSTVLTQGLAAVIAWRVALRQQPPSIAEHLQQCCLLPNMQNKAHVVSEHLPLRAAALSCKKLDPVVSSDGRQELGGYSSWQLDPDKVTAHRPRGDFEAARQQRVAQAVTPASVHRAEMIEMVLLIPRLYHLPTTMAPSSIRRVRTHR